MKIVIKDHSERKLKQNDEAFIQEPNTFHTYESNVIPSNLDLIRLFEGETYCTVQKRVFIPEENMVVLICKVERDVKYE